MQGNRKTEAAIFNDVEGKELNGYANAANHKYNACGRIKLNTGLHHNDSV